MKGGRRFRPRLSVTVAAIAFCALAVWLGMWQMRRAEEKEATQARLERLAAEPPTQLPAEIVGPEAFALRRVSVHGEYVDRYTILLDNKVHHGRVGYEVVSPLRIAGGNVHVLINRGWVQAGRTRDELPKITVPAGEQTVEGIAIVPSERVFELAREVPSGPVWQNLLLERYRAWSGLTLQPVVIEQTNGAGDGLIREWDRPDAGAGRNRGYALQWFSLAALAVVLYFALNFTRDAKRH